MRFLEKDLEDVIWETDNMKLEERGLSIMGVKLRQKRIGNYGISDIISVEKPRLEFFQDGSSYLHRGEITIYELKKDKVSISSFFQVLRYAKGVRSYLSKRDKLYMFDIKMVLIGKDIDINSDLVFLPTFMSSLRLYEYNFTIDGLIFNERAGFDLIDKGF